MRWISHRPWAGVLLGAALVACSSLPPQPAQPPEPPPEAGSATDEALTALPAAPQLAEPELPAAPAREQLPDAPSAAAQALSPVPPALRTAFQSALADLRAERYAAGAAALEVLHQGYPGYAGVLVNLGIAQAKLGDAEAARRSLRKALELQGSSAAWSQLGLLLRQDGQFAEARNAYERALELEPAYAPALLNLAILCEVYLQQLDCALRHYRRYLEGAPPDAEQVGLWIVDIERRAAAAGRR